jgi:hypothetical protein
MRKVVDTDPVRSKYTSDPITGWLPQEAALACPNEHECPTFFMPWKKKLACAAGQIEPILIQKLEFALEPVMNFVGEKSVRSKYIPALRLGCRHREQIIRVM